MPRLALIGFYCTLVFVAVTIPAGIYAQVHYGQSLANVDWLHGSRIFLTLSNILIVLGFRQAVIQGKVRWMLSQRLIYSQVREVVSGDYARSQVFDNPADVARLWVEQELTGYTS